MSLLVIRFLPYLSYLGADIVNHCLLHCSVHVLLFHVRVVIYERETDATWIVLTRHHSRMWDKNKCAGAADESAGFEKNCYGAKLPCFFFPQLTNICLSNRVHRLVLPNFGSEPSYQLTCVSIPTVFFHHH